MKEICVCCGQRNVTVSHENGVTVYTCQNWECGYSWTSRQRRTHDSRDHRREPQERGR